MHNPWIQDGHVYATNGHVILEAPMTSAALFCAAAKPLRGPKNLAKMFSDAFNAPEWRSLPELPPFDPCPDCFGKGLVPPELDGADLWTCDSCEGYGEAFRRIAVGDTGFCIRYMRLLSSLPSVQISPNGMNPCPFIFDGGRGIVMPMRTIKEVRDKYGAASAA
jgi:hypothetical protein